MKRIATLFFLLCVFICFQSKMYKEKTIHVMNEEKSNEGYFYIIFEKDIYLNDKLNKELKNVRIEEIYPTNKLNKLYNINKFYYKSDYRSNNSNIYNFNKRYLNLLNKHSLKKEIIDFSYNGALIYKLTVIGNYTEIKKISDLYNAKLEEKH